MSAFPEIIEAEDGISFYENGPRQWTVVIDGKDERTITQDERGFIAWIGFQDRHWSFSRATKACAEHARFHRAECERVEQECEAAIASLMSMTDAQRERLIGRLEIERDNLDYADSGVNVTARKAIIDRQIASIRKVVA